MSKIIKWFKKLYTEPRLVKIIEKDIFWEDHNLTETIYYYIYKYPWGEYTVKYKEAGFYIKKHNIGADYVPEVEQMIFEFLKKKKRNN